MKLKKRDTNFDISDKSENSDTSDSSSNTSSIINVNGDLPAKSKTRPNAETEGKMEPELFPEPIFKSEPLLGPGLESSPIHQERKTPPDILPAKNDEIETDGLPKCLPDIEARVGKSLPYTSEASQSFFYFLKGPFWSKIDFHPKYFSTYENFNFYPNFHFFGPQK